VSDARARGWGDPDSAGYRQNHIVGVTVGGVTVYVRREIAGLVRGFLSELVQRGYSLDQRQDDWGYNNRDIRGRPGVKSNHAWGLALDINAVANPMTSDGRVHTDMPPWVREVAHKWGFFWGADYSGARKDPMHFEFLGVPADIKKYPIGGTTPADEQDEEEDVRYRYWVTGKPNELWLTDLIWTRHVAGSTDLGYIASRTKTFSSNGEVHPDFHASLKQAA
jgi:D-alanyl-D-alanine carboxypeptidase